MRLSPSISTQHKVMNHSQVTVVLQVDPVIMIYLNFQELLYFDYYTLRLVNPTR